MKVEETKIETAEEPPKAPESPAKPLEPDIRDNRLLAALSYVGLLFVVPLLAGQRSEYAMFHCRQGIMVFAIQSLLSFVTWIPVVGPLVYVLTLAVSVAGIVYAWRGERWEMPIIGRYAQMLKI